MRWNRPARIAPASTITPVATVNSAMNCTTNDTLEKMLSSVSSTSARSMADTLGNSRTTACWARAESAGVVARAAAT